MSRYVDLSNPKIFHNGRDKYGNGIYHIPPDLPTDDAVQVKKGHWVDDLISRQDAKSKKVYSHERHEYVVPVAELDWLPSAQQEPERKNEPVGCNGCRYDWLGDPRCAKCARSFQDHYEERKEE